MIFDFRWDGFDDSLTVSYEEFSRCGNAHGIASIAIVSDKLETA